VAAVLVSADRARLPPDFPGAAKPLSRDDLDGLVRAAFDGHAG
jgi:hypothetical protein